MLQAYAIRRFALATALLACLSSAAPSQGRGGSPPLGRPTAASAPRNPADQSDDLGDPCAECPDAEICPTCDDPQDLFCLTDPDAEVTVGGCLGPLDQGQTPCPTGEACPCEDEITRTCYAFFGPMTGPWDRTLSLPKFDSSLGTLKLVVFETRLDVVDIEFGVENEADDNTCDVPVVEEWWIQGEVLLRKSPFASTDLKILTAKRFGDLAIPGLTTYDGSTDFDGSSGFTDEADDVCAYCKVCVDETLTDPECLTLDDFLGEGCLDLFAAGNASNFHMSECDNGVFRFQAREKVTIQVTYVYCPNLPPVACDDPEEEDDGDYSLCPGECTLLDVLANDCDPDCDPECACDNPDVDTCTGDPAKTIDPNSIRFCINGDENNPTTGPLTTAHGIATIVNGEIQYCANFSDPAYDIRSTTPDTFYYQVADGLGCYSNCARVDVTILPKPRADDDSESTCELTCIDIRVTENDDPQGNPDPLANIVLDSVEICDGAMNGNVFLPGDAGAGDLPDGWIRYCPTTPGAFFDTFTYSVANGYGCRSDCATVTIEVKLPPTAVDDPGYDVCAGQDVVIPVLDNDVATAGRPIVASSIRLCSSSADCGGSCGPVGGTPVANANGTFTFDADPGFRGGAFFYYQVRDENHCWSNCARVEIEVIPTPIARPDCEEIEEPIPTEVEICVIENDTIQGNPIPIPLPYTIEICVQPQHGMAITAADIDQVNGKITYRPDMTFVDSDTFQYRLLNPNVDECDSECTTVQVKLPHCPTINRRMPGSLLLYPEFDNRPGSCTIITVTNSRNFGDSVKVEFRYIDGETCLHTGRTELLTPKDTFTVYSKDHNPSQEQGYLYVFAKSLPSNGVPIVYNELIGQSMTIDGVDMFDFAMNAVSFKGVGEFGQPTDIDVDGIRDLNGLEYEEAPDEIFIPRFLGQGQGIDSQLILLNLSGGVAFTTEVDFLIYNDNEQQFSRNHTFFCWTRKTLLEISAVFGNGYLQMFSNDDPNEILGWEERESGWMKLNGASAESAAKVILDPAIYAVLIEVTNEQGVFSAAADLPWEYCTQDNGSLLPKGLLGDNED